MGNIQRYLLRPLLASQTHRLITIIMEIIHYISQPIYKITIGTKMLHGGVTETSARADAAAVALAIPIVHHIVGCRVRIFLFVGVEWQKMHYPEKASCHGVAHGKLWKMYFLAGRFGVCRSIRMLRLFSNRIIHNDIVYRWMNVSMRYNEMVTLFPSCRSALSRIFRFLTLFGAEKSTKKCPKLSEFFRNWPNQSEIFRNIAKGVKFFENSSLSQFHFKKQGLKSEGLSCYEAE